MGRQASSSGNRKFMNGETDCQRWDELTYLAAILGRSSRHPLACLGCRPLLLEAGRGGARREVVLNSTPCHTCNHCLLWAFHIRMVFPSYWISRDVHVIHINMPTNQHSNQWNDKGFIGRSTNHRGGAFLPTSVFCVFLVGGLPQDVQGKPHTFLRASVCAEERSPT